MGSIDKEKRVTHGIPNRCVHTEQSDRHARNQSRGTTGCSDKAKGHRPHQTLLGGSCTTHLAGLDGLSGGTWLQGWREFVAWGTIQQVHKDRDTSRGMVSP